ncbi:hypothetical protein [Bacillus thuringiensis]|uniref:hypothetical protein n=1 Tax=Bacillus thuringiensis TaxID=1428 RepID=UPI0015948F79|nr:hypothetical protein [Bacillus thuringiensis]
MNWHGLLYVIFFTFIFCAGTILIITLEREMFFTKALDTLQSISIQSIGTILQEKKEGTENEKIIRYNCISNNHYNQSFRM